MPTTHRSRSAGEPAKRRRPQVPHDQDSEPPRTAVAPGGAHGASLDAVIRDWPENPRRSAQRLMEYYGPPQEVSASRLVWYRTFDGWKRTELSREEVPHDFPSHHTDYLEQFIDYRVPVEMFSKLADFDGSVIAERTKGELSARCGGTSMNFVAINLAHDIVTGKRSVPEARREYARLARAFKEGDKPPYTQSFQFSLPKGNTADLDGPVSP